MVKKILITGAFGTIGRQILTKLLRKNYEITCFDIKNKKTLKIAKKFHKDFQIFWGDVRNKNDLKNALENMDIVLHLAFILPPIPIERLTMAEAVNVDGTRNIIEVIKEQGNKTKMIFASSIAMYGDTRSLQQPILTNTKWHPNMNDFYAVHKGNCADLLTKSKITYSIFVIGVAIPMGGFAFDDRIFQVELNNPIEVIHEDDVAIAFVNGFENNNIWGKIIHIGGGDTCRMIYRDFIQKSMETFGLKGIPLNIFGKMSIYYSSWMASEESNKLLHYQKHTFEETLKELKKRNRFVIAIVKLLRKPIIKYLEKKSKKII